MKNLKNKIGTFIAVTMFVGVGSISNANANNKIENIEENEYSEYSQYSQNEKISNYVIKDKMKNQNKKVVEPKLSHNEFQEIKQEKKKMKYERFDKKIKHHTKYNSNYNNYLDVKMNKNYIDNSKEIKNFKTKNKVDMKNNL